MLSLVASNVEHVSALIAITSLQPSITCVRVDAKNIKKGHLLEPSCKNLKVATFGALTKVAAKLSTILKLYSMTKIASTETLVVMFVANFYN